MKIKRKKGSKEWKDQANKWNCRKPMETPKEELRLINDKEDKKIKCQIIEEKLRHEMNKFFFIKNAQEWLKRSVDECDQ